MKKQNASFLKDCCRQIVAGFCIVGLSIQGVALPPVELCCGGGEESPSAQSGSGRTTTVIPRPPLTGEVNLTAPKVAAPGPALDFSGQPTAEEFFRSRLFEEPLVPVGGKPSVAENAALALAMRGYAKRVATDDLSTLDAFLAKYPKSPWRAALLTNLGLEAYRTGRYLRTMDSWAEAWRLAKDATEAPARALADRAAGELASMYARLGRRLKDNSGRYCFRHQCGVEHGSRQCHPTRQRDVERSRTGS